MKVFCNLFIVFIFFQTLLKGQKSVILKSNGNLETNYYHNTLAAYNDGYFILCSTEDSNSDLIISKYNNCHNHEWTKRYDSSLDLSVYDALVHNGQLVILMVTHFNSSTTRTSILLAINMDGEIQFSNRYNKDKFDNFSSLSRLDNSYHIFGPSTDFPDGGGHFAIDEKGDLLYANVLLNSLTNLGSDFGCVILDNGMAIRRHNNTLIACDKNQNVLWAKQFMNTNGLALNTEEPLAVSNGFVQVLNQDNELVLFKMDYQGNIVWTLAMNGQKNTSPVEYKSDTISLIWNSSISENEFRMAYTEVDQRNGDIITTKLFEFEEETSIGWSKHIHNSSGDLLLTGSNRLEGLDNQDIIFVNPHMSACVSTDEIISNKRPDLLLEDVTDIFETVPVNVTQQSTPFTVRDKDAFLSPQCINTKIIELDTSLDCNNNYVFIGLNESSEFIWSDGRTDSIRTFTEPLTISVKVNSCESNKEIYLNISESDCDCQVFIPNIIASNSLDPANRQLSIYSNCVFESFLISIYDRWGNLVFQSDDINESWSPFKSKKLSQGVYTVALEWTANLDQQKMVLYESVTILK